MIAPAGTDRPRARARALPGLGHTLSLIRDPLSFLSRLPAQGDLVVMRLGSQRVVMVCDPALTYQLLVDDRTFDKGGPLYDRIREVSGDNLVTCPHGQHRRLRKLCQPSFSSERLAGYGATMSAVAQSTAAGWHEGQVLDVVRELTALVARATASTRQAPGCSRPWPASSPAAARTPPITAICSTPCYPPVTTKARRASGH